MKINSNIPIFIILTLFVASNALLYRYLNNGYFIDKTPTVQNRNVENIIFSLIKDHEAVLEARNAEILRQAEELRNRRATVTDSEELRLIEEKLKALEAASKEVQDRVKSSENERKVAEKQAENNQLQVTELLASNSKMGAELDSINEEFNSYVATIKKTIIDKSLTETDKSGVNDEFRTKRGLDYVNNLIANIQDDKNSIVNDYKKILNERSEILSKGFTTLALQLNDNNFSITKDSEGLIKPGDSFTKLLTSVRNYKLQRNRELTDREEELLLEMENKLAELSELSTLEKLELENEIALLKKSLEESAIAMEEQEKLLSEKKAEPLPVSIGLVEADEIVDTSWVFLPGFWESDYRELKYSGKRVETIAWSRNNIEDNQVLTFYGDYNLNSELLLILYGNGRFKSFSDGYILSIKPTSKSQAVINILKNGIDENGISVYTQEVSVDNGISGDYYIKIANGALTLSINNITLIDSFTMDSSLSGRIGFANRETNREMFNISNIRLFKIK